MTPLWRLFSNKGMSITNLQFQRKKKPVLPSHFVNGKQIGFAWDAWKRDSKLEKNIRLPTHNQQQ